MKLNSTYNPFCMLVVYRETVSSYQASNPSDDQTYIEMAEIKEGLIGAFAPLSRRVSQSLGESLVISSQERLGGIIPKRLLYVSFNILDTELIWYSEPMQRRLFYSKNLQIPSGKFNMPWMVWHLKDKNLYIYATMDRPAMDTKLYKAPFHNTSSDGSVCMGTAYNVLAEHFTSFTNSMESVEDAFCNTIFNSHRDDNIMTGNINTFHKNMIEGALPFDYSILKDTDKTISNIIKPNSNGQTVSPGGELLPEEAEPEQDADDEEAA